jgi:hypothetical protein
MLLHADEALPQTLETYLDLGGDVKRTADRLLPASRRKALTYSSYLVGLVVWMRPLGSVQRMTPGSGCWSFQPGACFA